MTEHTVSEISVAERHVEENQRWEVKGSRLVLERHSVAEYDISEVLNALTTVTRGGFLLSGVENSWVVLRTGNVFQFFNETELYSDSVLARLNSEAEVEVAYLPLCAQHAAALTTCFCCPAKAACPALHFKRFLERSGEPQLWRRELFSERSTVQARCRCVHNRVVGSGTTGSEEPSPCQKLLAPRGNRWKARKLTNLPYRKNRLKLFSRPLAFSLPARR